MSEYDNRTASKVLLEKISRSDIACRDDLAQMLESGGEFFSTGIGGGKWYILYEKKTDLAFINLEGGGGCWALLCDEEIIWEAYVPPNGVSRTGDKISKYAREFFSDMHRLYMINSDQT